MLHQVMLLAAAGERLIGSVYANLAETVEADSELARVLKRLVTEETQHAEALDELRATVPQSS
jgi:rubrerythrin